MWKVSCMSSNHGCRVAAIIALVVIGCALASSIDCAEVVKVQSPPPILAKCWTDLEQRLKIQSVDIKLVSVQSIRWPNSALGLPEIGKMYAQAITPGWWLVLEAKDRHYLYTTSASAFRYGGPTRSWAYSMLYLQPIHNEPNMNSDLYQCSLLGTNSSRVASVVSDYYPQSDGAIIFTRRTSRSGFELLWVQADKPGREDRLYSAFAFGGAAFDKDRKHWAAYLRPMFAGQWSVAWGAVGQTSKPQILALPDGTDPGKIAWTDDGKLMILPKKENAKTAYELTTSDSPSWKRTAAYYFPDFNKFMLSKSESLEIKATKEDGKSGFEVNRIWFTGDNRPVAKISGFDVQGYDLVGPYAFVWGEKDGHEAAYSVDVSSGDTLLGLVGAGSDIQPFDYPPHSLPVPKATIHVE